MKDLKLLQEQIASLTQQEDLSSGGVSMSLLIDFSEPLRSTMKMMVKESILTVDALAEFLGASQEDTARVIDQMVDAGVLGIHQVSPATYRLNYAKDAPASQRDVWGTMLDIILEIDED